MDADERSETFMNATEQEEGFHLPAVLLGITQWAVCPLHWPFSWHTRSWDPWSVYPSLQENVSLAPCTYETPSFSPFAGAETYPHAATARYKTQHNTQNQHGHSAQEMHQLHSPGAKAFMREM